MEFPVELKTADFPRFEVNGEQISIYNLPFLDEIIFACFTFLFFLYVVSGKDVPDIYNYPIIFFLISFFFAFSTFSEDRVVIDFTKKNINIKNYNPLMNIIRKYILKLPSEIYFRNVNQVISDQTYFRKNGNKYYVYIITETPYKLKIAEFSNKGLSELFVNFLRTEMKRN